MTLRESDLHPDPLEQFRQWLKQAQAAGIRNADAMTVATATRDGRPSARVVLMRGLDKRGFAFFTNYESAKGGELAANPRAALVFYWEDLGRQVRVTGTVARVSAEESERYFSTRPRESRVAAWASRQSAVIESRAALEERFGELDAAYPGEDVSLPPFWGGYRVSPETIEFWEHRDSRLHDRLRYTRRPDGGWTIERLSP